MTWRSLLYVPANVPRFLDKAQARGADALILDLEDSVPDAQKAQARDLLATRWNDLRKGPSDLIVRINADMPAATDDLGAVVREGLCAIYLPKVSGPEVIGVIGDIVSSLEVARGIAPETIKIIPMIETPAALEAAFSIAQAHPRIGGLTLGSEDFATACGMMPTPENLFGPRQRVVFAARAAGIVPFGSLDSVANLSLDGLADLVGRSRDFGFVGATAVHPVSVPLLNSGFGQSDENRAWAAGVITALDAAEQQGTDAARFGGRMVDRPLRLRAEAIVKTRQSCGRKTTGMYPTA